MREWRAARAQVPQPEPLRAPLFRSLVEQFDPDERRVVLDLGAAHTQTVALFSQYRCRLDIADLADGLERLNDEPDPQMLPNRAAALLPRSHDEPTDVVLCWDILNYLNRPALTALMAQIAARSRTGTLVHSLIVYSEPQMAARPCRFIPLEDLSLINLSLDSERCEAPRYTPDDLKRCMSGYYIERAMLLGNGMQEFLFAL